MIEALVRRESGAIAGAIARRLVFLFLGVVLIVPPELVATPILEPVIRPLVLLLLLQLAPVLWPFDPDIFSPAAYSGLTAAIATISWLAAILVNGEVPLKWVTLTRGQDAALVARKVFLALSIGFAAYYIAFHSPAATRLRRLFPRVHGLVWNRRRLRFVYLVAGLAFLAAYGAFQSRLGIPILDFTQLGLGKQVWHEDPSLSWMLRGIEIGFLPVLIFCSGRFAEARGPRSLVAPAAALLAIGLLVLRVGQRGSTAAVIVVVLVMFHYHRRRLSPSMLIAICFVALTIGNVTLSWRLAPHAEERSFAFLDRASDPIRLLADHEDERTRFSALAVIVTEFPDNYPYLMGQSWTSIAAALIPRWIWPDKVNHFEWQDDRIMTRLRGSPVPTPAIGTFYANFSWPGIVFGMMALGLVHRALYEWLRAANGDRNVVLLYSAMLVYFGPSTLNLSTCLQYVLPLWMIVRFAGQR
jgi:hypothetical protein